MENGFDVILYDMNEFKLESERHILFKDFLKDEYNIYYSKIGEKFFSHKGLALCGFEFGIRDKNIFISQILKYLFKDYEISTATGETGHPDFILKKDNEIIYLELKLNGDSLRESQIRWFLKHKNKSVNKIIFIIYSIRDEQVLLQPL